MAKADCHRSFGDIDCGAFTFTYTAIYLFQFLIMENKAMDKKDLGTIVAAYALIMIVAIFFQAQKFYFWEENMKFSYFKQYLAPLLFEISAKAPKIAKAKACDCHELSEREKKTEETVKVEAPFKVLIVGDSFVNGGVGVELERALLKCTSTQVLRVGKPSTGLARRDYFDWREEIATQLASQQPNVIFAMFGANDGQGIPLDGKKAVYYGTPEWDAKYFSMVNDFMAILGEQPAQIFWIGNPIAKSSDYREKMGRLNSIYASSSAQYKNISFIPLWDTLKDKNGNYADYLPDSKGVMRLARESDGIHVTDFGGIIASKEIISKVRQAIPLACP